MEPRTPEMSALGRLFERIEREGLARAVGVHHAARGYLASRLRRRYGGILAVAATEEDADRLAGDLRFFLGKPNVVRIPVDAVLPYDGLSPDRSAEIDRLSGLSRLGEGVDAVVVSARGLARKVVPPSVLRSSAERIAVGGQLDRDAFSRRLVGLGYVNAPLVEDPGAFAVRGAIVDFWPPTSEAPIRVELFGDEVESLRTFDPATQRTTGSVDEVVVGAVREFLLREETKPAAIRAIRAAGDRAQMPSARIRALVESLEEGKIEPEIEGLLPAFYEGGLASLFDHLPPDCCVLLDDPVGLQRSLEELHEDLVREHAAAVERGELVLEPSAHFLDAAEVDDLLAERRRVEIHGLWLGTEDSTLVRFDLEETSKLRKELEEGQAAEAGMLTPLVDRLERFRERGVATVIACSSPSRADKIARLLAGREVRARVRNEELPEIPSRLWDASVSAHLLHGEISGGFFSSEARFALISDEEILGRRPTRRRSGRRPDLPSIEAFRDLKEGDLCVHVDHGLCRYGGLRRMQFQGVEADFLVLHFAGKDKLYLPVWKLRLIQKFVGAGAEHARLDRLGGASWEKTKRRVRDELLEMAAELLDIYARRKAHEGFAFPPPDPIFRSFEESFPWEETPDQEKAIRDVIEDMTSPSPMDRLVCGDVGFGKTEVAMRAAFLAVLGGKQVAVLVPTTLLAYQHHRSFSERMKGHPVVVDWISSLRSAKENRDVLLRVAEGTVDIVIGTHALLSPSVSFKDLGLLVIDEEHRFGVAHKEKIKKWKTDVDVLTLTATPIPRTLHMSLAGMRDMSVIQTPPPDRRSVRTFVLRFSPTEIREAILREKARGGQVFFVHDRVESIGAVHRFLQELVPEASFAVAHGKMAEKTLEKVIARFIAKEVDVLLSTTIVESGLDIPNANTILVNRADTLGLAQLHQLRGRVGRSSERAYAYFLVPADRALTRDAQKRLEVVQRLSELGSGFQIASFDLEIRGAGHLLGAKQSGHIEAVGFDLYLELLEEAVAEVRGEPVRKTSEPELKLPVPAFIPEGYLPDVHQRLLFYKKFSQANSEAEIEEVREELVDRAGHPPPEVDALANLMAIKARLRHLDLRGMEAGPSRLAVVLGREATLDPVRLAELVSREQGRLRLTPELKLVARIPAELPAAALFDEAHRLIDEVAGCLPAKM